MIKRWAYENIVYRNVEKQLLLILTSVDGKLTNDEAYVFLKKFRHTLISYKPYKVYHETYYLISLSDMVVANKRKQYTEVLKLLYEISYNMVC